jgi:hypothetical protein
MDGEYLPWIGARMDADAAVVVLVGGVLPLSEDPQLTTSPASSANAIVEDVTLVETAPSGPVMSSSKGRANAPSSASIQTADEGAMKSSMER